MFGKGLESKLREGAPLFEVQVLLRVAAPGKGRAKAVLGNLEAAFATTADRNHLKVRGLPLMGTGFLGSDLPWRRGRFDRRFATGLFRPGRRNILTTAEARRVPEAAHLGLPGSGGAALGGRPLGAAGAGAVRPREGRPDPGRSGA